jgi:hypothetical protein
MLQPQERSYRDLNKYNFLENQYSVCWLKVKQFVRTEWNLGREMCPEGVAMRPGNK